jgi:hypothetical protein
VNRKIQNEQCEIESVLPMTQSDNKFYDSISEELRKCNQQEQRYLARFFELLNNINIRESL